MDGPFTLIATATFGLESVVTRELAALGYESRADRPGWLRFQGDGNAVARCNLWLRAADRLLLELASFPAVDFGALFDRTTAVAWEDILPRDARVPVRGRSVKSQLSSVPACQRIVKKAIVERLKAKYGLSTLPEDGPTFPVEVAILKDEARLLVDTTGAGLHKRGYRTESGEAPLKETLAAGLVLLSAWNRERPFLDPFCGTGTLAIEAALVGRNRAPGIGRAFVSETWPWLGAAPFGQARDEARERESPRLTTPLDAFDRDPAVLRLARRSAEKAGVAGDIRFERRDFGELERMGDFGCLVTNPPYGDRLSDAEEVRELYRSMPAIFRRLPTWSFFVLTARRDFERLLGQEATRRRKLYNGDIECTYYQFFGPRSERTERQAFGGLDERASRQAEIFANRLRKRAHHLRKWPSKRGTDCYRLYDRDIKEVPLVVDRYGDALLLLPPSDRLESRTRAQQEDWLDEMARVASEALDLPLQRIFLEGRDSKPLVLEVKEEGISFEVHLPGDGQPGLAPSDRVLRRWLRESSRDRKVLVLHSSAAAFGVAAAVGGASSTTNVLDDPSQLSWARGNFRRNDLSLERHRFLASDIGSFLEGDGGRYDLVAYLASSCTHTAEHLQRLAARTTSTGTCWIVISSPREKLDLSRLDDWKVEHCTARSIPEEFRNRKAHRVWRLTRT